MTDIQLVLVEDDQDTRVSLRAALRSQPGLEVASEATNGETGLVLMESIDVDVAVVDGSLPDMTIPEFARQLRQVQAESYVTQSRLLVLVNADQTADLSVLVSTDIDGYCLKDTPIEQLAAAVREVYLKGRYVDEAIAPALNNLSVGSIH